MARIHQAILAPAVIVVAGPQEIDSRDTRLRRICQSDPGEVRVEASRLAAVVRMAAGDVLDFALRGSRRLSSRRDRLVFPEASRLQGTV